MNKSIIIPIICVILFIIFLLYLGKDTKPDLSNPYEDQGCDEIDYNLGGAFCK